METGRSIGKRDRVTAHSAAGSPLRFTDCGNATPLHRAIMRQRTVVLDDELYHGATSVPGKAEVFLFYGTRSGAVRNTARYLARHLLGMRSRNSNTFARLDSPAGAGN